MAKLESIENMCDTHMKKLLAVVHTNAPLTYTDTSANNLAHLSLRVIDPQHSSAGNYSNTTMLQHDQNLTTWHRRKTQSIQRHAIGTKDQGVHRTQKRDPRCPWINLIPCLLVMIPT